MLLDLTQLKGNEALRSAFSAAVQKKSVPHTWIIEGPDGSGKHTFAEMFCRVMMCVGETRPCGKCGNCVRFDGGHIDVHYVVPLKKENKTVGVGEIRALYDDIYINPISAPCKVYIVENADAVTVAGQNALLKMAEEPPANVYFLLLTRNRHSLLPTLVSRAVCYTMEPLSSEEARGLLGKVRGADDEKIEIALRLSGGYVGSAKSFLKGETVTVGISSAEKFLKALASGSEYELMMCGSGISDTRDKARNALVAISSAVAETARIKAGVIKKSSLPIEETERKAASLVSYETLVAVYRLICDAERDIAGYTNVNMSVTELLLKVWQVRRADK